MPWLVVAGVLVAALSLRSHITSVPTVAPHIMSDLGVSAAAAGMLTTAPLLMFALCTPAAALVIRRAGPELTLLLTLAGVLLGTLVRLGPGYGWVLTGMLIMGVSITLGNVVIPVIIRRDLPSEHASTATAGYAAMMNLGSLVTTLGTAPLAELLGWSPALAAWMILTIAGLVLWAVHMVRRARAAEHPRVAPVVRGRASDAASALTGPVPVLRERSLRTVLGRPLLWLLTLAFASQSAAYFALTAWLPTLLVDTTGASLTVAGALASVFQGVAVVGPFLAPLLLRHAGPVVTACVIAGCWLAMILGMLLAPELFWLWAALGAVAHASGFVVTFTAVVQTSRSDAEAATMSAVIQGCGYLIATIGAPLMGALYEASGAWTMPLLAVLAMTVVYAVALVGAMLLVRGRRG